MRHQAQPGGEAPASPEALHRRGERLQRHRGDQPNSRDGHQAGRVVVMPGTVTKFSRQVGDLGIEGHDPVEQECAQRAPD